MTLLSVVGVSKSFFLYPSQWARLRGWLGKKKTFYQAEVLQNIAFEMSRGESIGIVGQNGAGKSTLLKLICGLMQPSQGTVHVAGRITAILELGIGFDPELSGRDNAATYLSLIGCEASTIAEVIPELEAFADIGPYFDRPLRTYSSGMHMRLAFAAATALRPDILIVDEALSVGDAAFQHKCFDRILAYRDQGTSLLFVSHDRGSVVRLCTRAILLDGGSLIADGPAAEVCDTYTALIALKNKGDLPKAVFAEGEFHGTGEAYFTRIELQDHTGQPSETLITGTRATLVLETELREDLPSLVMGFAIKDRMGFYQFGTNSFHTNQIIEVPKAGSRIRFEVALPVWLGPGSYSLQAALVDRDTHLTANYEWRERALIFTVENHDKPVFVGSTWLDTEIKVVQCL